MDLQIGIDLGTSNCCVAVFKDNVVEIIQDEEGHRTVPSYVSFTDNGALLGHAAKARVHIDPKNTIFNVMLLLGKKRMDVLSHLQKLPYEVIETKEGRLKIKIAMGGVGSLTSQTLFPEEILALFLSHLKQMASKYLQQPVTGAVISHPHSFNLLQIQLLRTAATTAGLVHVKLTSSTALAALAFGHHNNLRQLRVNQRELTMVVFNVGGGSTEASLVVCNGGNYLVSGASSTFNCSGNELTSAIFNYLRQELKKRSIDISDNLGAQLKLSAECEKIKKALSGASTAYLEIDTVSPGTNGVIPVSRDEFSTICDDLFMSAMEVVNDALAITEFDISKVDQCILVGGSTRIPRLQSIIGGLFRNPLNKNLNFDEAIACGAALQAAHISAMVSDPQSLLAKNFILNESVPNSIGLELENGRVDVIVHRGVNYPTETVRRFDIKNFNPINFKLFEGENVRTRGNIMVAFVQANPVSLGSIQVKTCYTQHKTLAIEVFDEKTSALLLKHDNACSRIHSTEELEFMRVRLVSFEEQLQRKYKYMEAKNILEEYIITVKSKTVDGGLKGQAVERMVKKCDDTLEAIDQMDVLGSYDDIKEMQYSVEKMYNELLHSPPSPSVVPPAKRDPDQVHSVMSHTKYHTLCILIYSITLCAVCVECKGIG